MQIICKIKEVLWQRVQTRMENTLSTCSHVMEGSRRDNFGLRRMTDCPIISLGLLVSTVYNAARNGSR